MDISKRESILKLYGTTKAREMLTLNHTGTRLFLMMKTDASIARESTGTIKTTPNANAYMILVMPILKGYRSRRLLVVLMFLETKKIRYTYQYDDNGDLSVFDIDGFLNKFIVFTYTEDHFLLAKEEREKLKQIDLFEGGSVFSKGEYYKYDSQSRLVLIEENDKGNTSIIKHIVYYNDGTTKTIEKGFLGEAICTWHFLGKGSPIRRIRIKRQSPTITIVTQTDTTNDEIGNPLLMKCSRLTYRFNKQYHEWKSKKEEWKKSFEYVFDKENNWIQREEFLDGRSIRVTQRVIEYW